MPGYDFRLRFHFHGGDHIEHDTGELVVHEDEKGRRLRLTSGSKDTPLKKVSTLALVGGPYDFEEDAHRAAMAAKRALLVWAVARKVGVDVGDDKLHSFFYEQGLALFEKQLGRTVRNDVHGIDVYPHQEGLLFASSNVKAALGMGAQEFVETVATHFRAPLALSDKQLLACELYCSSFFDFSFRSRLITLVSAIEALLEPPTRCPAALELVKRMQETVRNAGLDKATTAAMLGSLNWLHQDSIGQTGRSLSERLLPGKEYLGMSASRFFGFCYQLRSQIVHYGRPHDSEVDLREVANACQEFLADLLLASFDAPTA